MVEDPNIVPNDYTNLNLMYASASIEVLKEEEAYSFLSLVADCGGTLGLFIGFNFFMIWDWMIVAFRTLPFSSICTPGQKQKWPTKVW